MSDPRLRRFFKAAAGESRTVDYPINASMPRYNRVPIMRIGEFTPSYWYANDGVFAPDEAYLRELAEVYNPEFYVAALNEDHDRYWGPASGLIIRLYVEGSGDDAVLYADLVNVDRELATEIDEGKWPHRSIEWVDAYDDLAWYQAYFEATGLDPALIPSVEDLFFYGDHPRYLTGLAVLGVRSPAVPGLGSMPERAQAPDDMQPAMPVAARQFIPRTASSEEERGLRVKSLTPYTQEDDMPKDKAAGDTGTTEKVIPVTADEQLKAANDRIAELEASGQADRDAKVAAEKVAAHGASETAEALKTAQRAEARVAATQRDDLVKSAAADHTRNGKMAGDNRDRYVGLATQLHGMEPRELTAADGSTTKAEKSPLTLLNEFIANQPAGVYIGEVAGEPPADQSDSHGSNPAASAASTAIRERTAALEAAKKAGGDA